MTAKKDIEYMQSFIIDACGRNRIRIDFFWLN